MREAMRWLLRIRDNSVTEGDLADWTHWYESDPRNKAAFDQMQGFWMGSGALAAGPQGAARIRRLLEHESHARPGETAARSSRKYHLAFAASIAAFGIVGAVLHLYPRLTGRLTNAPLVRETVLPDGSRVELAPKSFLTVRYTPTERRVELRGGEAYFNVVHNSAWPFIVSVHDIQVRDVGTTFNIRDGGGQTVVTVATGAVDVYSLQPMTVARNSRPNLTGIRVTAGRELTWNHRSPPVVIQADPQRTLAWRQGRLDYIDEPLSGVIADVNRYLARPVLIKDRPAGELAFTGTVMTGSAEEWVQALPSEFPVELISTGGRSLLLASRPATPADSARSRR